MKNVKIKIAQVITRLDWGGSPDIVRILCGRLDPSVYDMTLISGPSGHMTGKTRDFLKAFKGRHIEISSLRRDISPIMDLAALFSLYSCFRKERFDIIHTHTAKAGLVGRIAGRAAGCRAIVHTPHGHNIYGYFGPAMTRMVIAVERFCAGLCDKIMALTELEKTDMMRFGIAPAGKITVIYQGLELDRYPRSDEVRRKMRGILGVKDDQPLVGMISRLEPVKGPGYFIEAAALVVKGGRPARFIVVGDGSMRSALEKKAVSLGLKDRCIFAGWREDIPEILSALDLFVLPSLNEAVGMALVEAMVSGVASVASRVGGVPEIVDDGRNGILVPPAEPSALAGAIEGLLADDTKRALLARSARDSVLNKFDAAKMTGSVSGLYQELLIKRARSIK